MISPIIFIQKSKSSKSIQISSVKVFVVHICDPATLEASHSSEWDFYSQKWAFSKHLKPELNHSDSTFWPRECDIYEKLERNCYFGEKYRQVHACPNRFNRLQSKLRSYF